MSKKQLSGLLLGLTLRFFAALPPNPQPVLPGAAQLQAYLALLQDKQVAWVVNATACIGAKHWDDVWLEQAMTIQKVFAPEHGCRSDYAANKAVNDTQTPTTGLPILALYGQVKRPTQEMLADGDVVASNIQAVGMWCYT